MFFIKSRILDFYFLNTKFLLILRDLQHIDGVVSGRITDINAKGFLLYIG